jgi:hypothetical protein
MLRGATQRVRQGEETLALEPHQRLRTDELQEQAARRIRRDQA